MGRRCVVAGALTVALLGCSSGVALAAGGASIGSAPTVSYGAQEFGNTATDGPIGGTNADSWFSWWLLPVITGDEVTVDYTGQVDNSVDDTIYEAHIYPVGTNDFNLPDASPVALDQPDGSGHGQLRYRAPRDGTLPLDFYVSPQEAGPYTFTAYVTHVLVLSLHAHQNHRAHATRFSVAVHNPDGAAIPTAGLHATYQYRSRRSWRTIRINGPLQFTVRWRRAQQDASQTVRVEVSGPSYRTATETIRVKDV